jgi:hypothetical protein
MSITTNILRRTFQLSFGECQGTCFTIDYDNRQYIVTARHIVEPITDFATIRIKHEKIWKDCPVNLVGHGEGEVDISVLAAPIQISPAYLLPPTSAMVFGQDVYFLGFPYGWNSEVGELNQNFPLPLIKKAIMSGMDLNSQRFLLDGHNNPGFSGGPVVFSELGKPGAQLSVAGVISGYRFRNEPVYLEGKRTPLEFKYNTGIILVYGIKHAIDLISENPIGFNLENENTS